MKNVINVQAYLRFSEMGYKQRLTLLWHVIFGFSCVLVIHADKVCIGDKEYPELGSGE